MDQTTPTKNPRRVQLMHGDSFEIITSLPPKSYNLVLTDPPYSDHVNNNARKHNKTTVSEKYEIDIKPLTSSQIEKFAFHAVRVCSGWLLIFCAAEQIETWKTAIEKARGKWVRTQIWLKPDAPPNFTGRCPAQGFEAIATAWCGEKGMQWNGGGKKGVYEYSARGKHRPDWHPTPKPPGLISEIIQLFSNEDDRILDPFAGSSVVPMCAAQLDRWCSAIEIEKTYFEKSKVRLEPYLSENFEWVNAAQLKQPSLF